MADIELVIKIPKELYEGYKGRPPMLGDAGMDMIAQSIANGTQLPEYHGDLKDVNDIWNNIPDVNVLTNHFTTYDIQHFIDDAPVIIKEGNNNVY